MNFLSPSIITLTFNNSTTEFNGVAGGQLTLSDHSRSPLNLDYDIIQKEQRMANGTMRKYVVSKKKTFSCSWSMLPTKSSMIVDSNADAKLMKKYYEKYCAAPLRLSLYHGRNSSSLSTTSNPAPHISAFSANVSLYGANLVWTASNANSYSIVITAGGGTQTFDVGSGSSIYLDSNPENGILVGGTTYTATLTAVGAGGTTVSNPLVFTANNVGVVNSTITPLEVPSFPEIYNVFWSNFSYEIEKRYVDFDYWNVNAEFTEI
jgi:hypothetical protein